METIVFIVDNIALPRCIKRVIAFYNSGYKCIVFGYSRKGGYINNLPEAIQFESLGVLPEGGGYFNKISRVHSDVKSIVNKYKGECRYFYTFGFVAGLMISFYNVNFIYEISDIRYGSYKSFSWLVYFFKALDKRIIKKSFATVLTSGGFQKYLDVKKKKILVVPNKVSNRLSSYERCTLQIIPNTIRFAFVGSIRYNSILAFAKVVGDHFPNYQFHFYGSSSLPQVKERCGNMAKIYSNVFTHGAFKNPDDLSAIYSNIDVVVSSYDVNTLNERIAEPNKLYESLFFCRPIIVSHNTFLADQVDKFGCGYSIDTTSEESIIKFISNLDVSDLLRISNDELKIDKKELIDNSNVIINLLKNENMVN